MMMKAAAPDHVKQDLGQRHTSMQIPATGHRYNQAAVVFPVSRPDNEQVIYVQESVKPVVGQGRNVTTRDS